MPEPTAGARALFDWIQARDLSYRQVGADIGVSDVTVMEWARGSKRASGIHPELIERYTGGAVSRALWQTPAERARLKAVVARPAA